MTRPAASPVRNRRVLYIPGYDPFPARRYRELYRKEGQAQAEISGYQIAMKPGLNDGEGFGWRVAAMIDGQPVRTEIEVLSWSDIVQESRAPSVLGTYGELFRTAWNYTFSGALFRVMRLRKGPVLAALYPVAALLAQALLAALLAMAMYRIVQAMGVALLGAETADVISAAAALPALATGALVLRWFRENDAKFFAYYLMHDFAYSASEKGAYPDALEARLVQFRRRLRHAMQSDVDEVLIVGHSSGAHLAVSLLADLLREEDAGESGPSVALLSLGHVVPMVSFLPGAWRLRRDLLALSIRSDVAWVDVTAPGDGCCFALCDPVAVSGLGTSSKQNPLVFSAAFTKSLSPPRWKALRWRFFRLHFQYLCAFDRPLDYDYFQITAGPLRLRDRYAGRGPSKSRIERALSGYRNTAP